MTQIRRQWIQVAKMDLRDGLPFRLRALDGGGDGPVCPAPATTRRSRSPAR